MFNTGLLEPSEMLHFLMFPEGMKVVEFPNSPVELWLRSQ